jgi:DNA-binding HxlR family transcriptional regulator
VAKRKSCVDAALSILENRWTVSLLREAFHGARRFGQFAQALGIARTVLATRLDELVKAGLLERHEYDTERGWHEYRLTRKGLDLFPAIVALTQWSARYGDGDAVELRHRGCGPIDVLVPHCAVCDKPIEPRDAQAVQRIASSHSGAPTR